MIDILTSLGYDVRFVERKEKLSRTDKNLKKMIKRNSDMEQEIRKRIYSRGVRITAIDGIKFSGSVGNQYARQLLDEPLSEKRTKQLEKIKKPRVAPLPEDLAKELRRVQRMANKMRKSLTPEDMEDPKKQIPKITKKQIRYTLSQEGIESAFKELVNYERRIKKLVPTWLWEDFIMRIDLNTPYFSGQEDYSELWNQIVQLVYSADIDKIGYYEHYDPLRQLLYEAEDLAGKYKDEDCIKVLNQMMEVLNQVQ